MDMAASPSKAEVRLSTSSAMHWEVPQGQLTDQSGQVTYAKSYDPYGVVTQASGASQSAYGFTGEQQDSYIKLIDLRSRMYSPETGRFTSKDSWLGDYNRPLSLNRWNYVEGNPINFTDPSGYRTVSVLLSSFVGASNAIPEEEPQDIDTINSASDHSSTPSTNPLDRIGSLLDFCKMILFAAAPPPPSSPNVDIGLTYEEDDNNGSVDQFRIRISNLSGDNVYLNNVHFGIEDALQFYVKTKDIVVRPVNSEHLKTVKPGHFEETAVPNLLQFSGSYVDGPPYMWNERVTVEVGIYATFSGFGFKYQKINPYTIDTRWRH
jgi:RHS repeat-associated protein